MAQDGPAEPAPAPSGQPDTADNKDGIDDIVVTARKRAENLQSVPIAVMAIDAKGLEQRNVRTLADVAQFSPNVSIDQGARMAGGSAAASIYIRGIGQTNFAVTADPGVGVYIDGVYYGRTVGFMLETLDLDRVEVLRGPQGTLFGRNTIGGAINLVSAMPTSTVGGYLQAGYGSFNERQFKASLNVPINDTLGIRISGSSRNRDGYSTSLITGLDQDNVDNQSVRGVVRWRPSSDLTITLIGDYSDSKSNGQAQHLVAVDPTKPILGLYNRVIAPRTPYGAVDSRWFGVGWNNYSTAPSYSNFTVWGTSGTIEWALAPEVTLTSITAYRRLTVDNSTDVDGTALDYQLFQVSTRQHQFSEELRVGGSAFDNRLKWLLGGFYYLERADDFYAFYIARGLAAPPFRADLTENQYSHLETDSKAAFAQATFDITNKLSLTAGIRYGGDQKTDAARAFRVDSGAIVIPVGSYLKGTFKSTTPKVGLEYRLRPTAMLYASIADGFKAGGINYAVSDPANFSLYKPEKVRTFELGAKTDWFDRRLRINGAVFYSQYKDLQLVATPAAGATPQCPSTAVGNCQITLNAARVDIKGAEFEITARPVAWFELFGGLGYLENKFKSIDPVLLANSHVNYNSQLPKTPRWSVNLGAQVSVPLTLGNLTARADYSYKSRQFEDTDNDPRIVQPAFGLLSARLALATKGDQWEFAVSGQNLANKRYVTSAFSAYTTVLGTAVEAYGPPRTVLGTIKFKFGTR